MRASTYGRQGTRNPFAMPRGAGGSMFRLRIRPDNDEMAMQQCADIITGLAEANMRWLAKNEHECCLGCAGVRYVPPQKCTPEGLCQDLYDAKTIMQIKKCTCADGVAYEVAVRALRGEPCRVRIIPQYDREGNMIPRRYHAVIETADGRIEDVVAELEEAVKVGGCACKERKRR